MIIKSCPVCGVKNRVTSHDSNVRPVCGKCGAQLLDNSNDSSYVSSCCVICGRSHKATEVLLNGTVYHKECYVELNNEIDETDLRVKSNERQVEQLEFQLREAGTLIYKIKAFFSGNKTDVESVKRQIELIRKDIHELANKKSRLKEVLTDLYTFWPTYPPDWEDRRLQVRSRSDYCEECGTFYGQLHIHHSIPISKGGSHAIDNLVLLCEDCHTKVHGGMEFSYSDFARIGAFGRRVNLIQNAIRDRGILHFHYRKYDGQRSVRSISPEGLKQVGKSLCVYGYCYLRDDSRTFAIKRMKGVKVVSEPNRCYDI